VRHDLRVVTEFDQRPALREREPRGGGRFQLAGEEAGDGGFRRALRRVVDDEAQAAEQRFEPGAEGLGHACAGPVGSRQRVERVGRELRRRQRRAQAVDGREDRRVEQDRRDRDIAGVRRGAEADHAPAHLGVQHGARSDLLPVVVLRFHPEDRDGRNAVVGGHLCGQSHRGQRLQQRVERAAEQARLLPGDHRDRGRVGQARSGGPSLGRRATTILLGRHCRDEGGPVARMGLYPPDSVGPGVQAGGVARVKPGEPRKVERVVGREPADPRKATDVDGEAHL
jgi:hypothetical protein